MSRKPIPPEVKREIARRLAEGRGTKIGLAKFFGVSQSVVTQIAKQAEAQG